MTRPPHGTDFVPRCSLELLFTVMLDVSTARKENNEKVCPFLKVVSILTAKEGQCKLSLYLFKRDLVGDVVELDAI